MSENQRTDRIEERLADLEKRCAMLERHYAPAEHNPDSARLAALLERLDGAGITLLDRDTYDTPRAPAPKDEPWFTMDAFLRVTHDPCAVCRDRVTRDDVSLCFECNIERWNYGDPMPSEFELHEALK